MGKKFKPKELNYKKCHLCKSNILENENYCTLVSHCKGKIIHQDHWHGLCWRNQVQLWIEKAVKEIAETTLDAVPGSREILKKALSRN